MAKRIPGRLVFRKIRGKVVPVRISNVKGNVTEKTYKQRKIVATSKDRYFGKAEITVPKKGRHIDIDGVIVEKDFRRRGIATQLMKRVSDFAKRIDKPFLRTTDLQSTSMARIRKNLGKTRFFADQFGPYGEQTKRIGFKEAMRIIRENKTPYSKGRQVSATTLLKGRRKKK